MTSAGIKVSVVVPVYNPGEHIEGLIDSLAGQSLPPDEFEVVFVDDGSTDDTPQRLERACALHPHMRMTTIPNSGWPGRPRNVGTDLAQGEYVFYADNDDEFYPESLERLHAMAAANGADIVYGKIVRTGRPTPYWTLWKRNVEVADPLTDNAFSSRTVHKLFRRQFLLDHAIRFPEGKVRLEDFAFMGQAIPRAKVISILADYPCYRWIHRTDGTNSSTASVSAARYWGYFAQALQIAADNAGEGELLDAARLAATSQAFSRFAPSKYQATAEPRQRTQFDAVREVLTSQVPDRLDARLPVLKRLRVHALRDDDKPRFDALQELRTQLSFEASVESMAWQEGALHVAVRADLRGPADVTTFEPVSDEVQAEGLSMLRMRVGPDLARTDPDSRLLLAEDQGTLELTVRQRGTGLEWPLPSSSTSAAETTADGVRLGMRVTAVIDPQHGYFGQQLDDGIWDVHARVQFLGEGAAIHVSVPAGVSGGRAPAGNRTARWYTTTTGRLSVKLAFEAATAKRAGTSVSDARWDGDALRLTVANPPSARAWVVLRHRAGGDGIEAPLRDGAALLPLGALRDNQVADAYLRLESPGAVREERLVLGGRIAITQQAPYAVATDGSRGLSVRRLAAGEAPPPPVTIHDRRLSWEPPELGRLVAMAPKPVQRALRSARRRWKAMR